MEIKVPTLTHREYVQLVEYMSKQIDSVPHDRGEMGGEDRINVMEISSIGGIKGNPPTYQGVVITASEERKYREALKGLIDFLAIRDSNPRL